MHKAQLQRPRPPPEASVPSPSTPAWPLPTSLPQPWRQVPSHALAGKTPQPLPAGLLTRGSHAVSGSAKPSPEERTALGEPAFCGRARTAGSPVTWQQLRHGQGHGSSAWNAPGTVLSSYGASPPNTRRGKDLSPRQRGSERLRDRPQVHSWARARAGSTGCPQRPSLLSSSSPSPQPAPGLSHAPAFLGAPGEGKLGTT